MRHHAHLEGSLLTVKCGEDMVHFVSAARVLFGSGMGAGSNCSRVDNVLSCSEKDVTRVFAGILAHRLSVQAPPNGPFHSLSHTAVLEIADTETSALLGTQEESVMTVYGVLAAVLHSV